MRLSNRDLEPPHSLAPFEFLVLALSFFALGTLAVEAMFPLEPATREILAWADAAVCVVFLIDFGIRLAKAENRWRYMITWGWLDLVSSIPAIPIFPWGRLARVFRILRLLRGVRATKVIAEFILDRRSQSAFLAVGLVSLLIITSSAIAIMHVEKPPTATINGPVDAILWSVATLSTVGSPDHYPLSTEGRVIGAVLMIAGVGLFGIVSGLVAAWFLAPANRRYQSEMEEMQVEIKALRQLLEARHTHSSPSGRG